MSEPDRPLRIGMIGTGFIARFHLQALVAVRDATVTAAWSPHIDACRGFAAEVDEAGLGPCSATNSLEELIEGNLVDAVWILGPNDTRLGHMRALHAAAKKGTTSIRAVACEKPLARTVAEANEMLSLVKEAGLAHAYLENQVFAPSVRKGKDVLWRRAVPTAGRPYIVRASEEHSGPHRPWFWQAERQGGGVLLDMMCHCVEVGRFLLTEPGAPRDSLRPIGATGSVATLKWSQPAYAAQLQAAMGDDVDYRRRPAEDVAHGRIDYETDDGQQLTLETTTSWAYVGAGLRIAIEMLGPEYSMNIDTLATNLEVFMANSITTAQPKGTETGDTEDLVEKQNSSHGQMPVLEDEVATYGYVAEDRHVVESFRKGTPPDLTFEDGVEVVRLLMALYRSAELGRTVRPDEEDLTNYIPPVARPS